MVNLEFSRTKIYRTLKSELENKDSTWGSMVSLLNTRHKSGIEETKCNAVFCLFSGSICCQRGHLTRLQGSYQSTWQKWLEGVTPLYASHMRGKLQLTPHIDFKCLNRSTTIEYHINIMSQPLPMLCPFTLNPWHGVSPGINTPDIVNAIIEIPKGSKVKYEMDKASGLLKLDRILFSAVHYPHNYGFIPQTYCDDHDPLDILVLCSFDVEPLTIIEAKVLGVMNMVDQGQADDKIIAVATNDIAVRGIDSMDTLPPHLLLEVRRFFEDYKKLQGKEVAVNEFRSKQVALQIIKDAFDLYDKTFKPKVAPLLQGMFVPAQEKR